MLHGDVKRLGNVPDGGGGWCFTGRAQGQRNRTATLTARQGKDGGKNWGHWCVHTVVDDQSRVAYAEIHDEQALIAIGMLRRAVLWFAARGVVIERVLADNGSCYRSDLWRQQCLDLDVVHKRTRPYRPQPSWPPQRRPSAAVGSAGRTGTSPAVPASARARSRS